MKQAKNKEIDLGINDKKEGNIMDSQEEIKEKIKNEVKNTTKEEVSINVETFCSIKGYSNMIAARLRMFCIIKRLPQENTMSEWDRIFNQCMNS